MGSALVLSRSRQVSAEDSPAFAQVAERFRRAGELERAAALCRDGLRRFPDHLSARVTLGWALLDLARYDEARVELERVIKRAPDNLAAIRGLAQLHDHDHGHADDEVAEVHSHPSWTSRDAQGTGSRAAQTVPSAPVVATEPAALAKTVDATGTRAPGPAESKPEADAKSARFDPAEFGIASAATEPGVNQFDAVPAGVLSLEGEEAFPRELASVAAPSSTLLDSPELLAYEAALPPPVWVDSTRRAKNARPAPNASVAESAGTDKDEVSAAEVAALEKALEEAIAAEALAAESRAAEALAAEASAAEVAATEAIVAEALAAEVQAAEERAQAVAAEARAAEMRAEEARAEEERVAAILAAEARAADARAEEERVAELRAAEQRAEEARAAEARAEEERLAEARAAEQRAEEARAAEARAEEERLAELRAAEQRAEEARAEEERVAAILAAEARAAEARAAEMWAAEAKAAEEARLAAVPAAEVRAPEACSGEPHVVQGRAAEPLEGFVNGSDVSLSLDADFDALDQTGLLEQVAATNEVDELGYVQLTTASGSLSHATARALERLLLRVNVLRELS